MSARLEDGAGGVVRIGAAAGLHFTCSLQDEGQLASQSAAASQLVQSAEPEPEQLAQHESHGAQLPPLSYSPSAHVPSPHDVGAGGEKGGGDAGGAGGGTMGGDGGGSVGGAGGGGEMQVVHSSLVGPVQPAPVPSASPLPVHSSEHGLQTSEPELQSA